LVIFFNFFLNVSVSYSIKCKEKKKTNKKTGLNGTEAGASIFSATAELCLLKQPLVKRKFLSLSEVLSLNLLHEV
jgi:hypothetical protein